MHQHGEYFDMACLISLLLRRTLRWESGVHGVTTLRRRCLMLRVLEYADLEWNPIYDGLE
jgi:hypothetical protein